MKISQQSASPQGRIRLSRFSHGIVLSTIPYLLATAAAGATFACSIENTPNGHAGFYEEPSENSRIIRRLPEDGVVSLFDGIEDPEFEDWFHVAYSLDDEAAWGSGERG